MFLLLFLFSNFLVAQEVICERKITSKNNNEILIEIQITKNTINGFGKIEEAIPVGFTPKIVDKGNGVYSFIDGKVKFLWLEVPSTSTIKVAYKLTGIGVNLIHLSGNFSYLINDESLKAEIKTVQELIIPSKEIPSYSAPTNTENILPKSESKEDKKISTKTTSEKKTYKVQIGAYKNSKWKLDYTNIKKLSFDVNDGFTRYYSGNFKTQQEAEEHQKELVKKGYMQTFVVYFINDIRYTLPK